MGILYRADDEHLIAERNYAKGITREYNQTHPDREEDRKNLMGRLLWKSRRESWIIETPFYCNYGYRISIGKNFFSNFNVTILDGGQVTIGDNVYIAPNVGIYTARHPTDVRRRNLGYEWALPVVIGDNVWIGGNATIMPGVTIGSNGNIVHFFAANTAHKIIQLCLNIFHFILFSLIFYRFKQNVHIF